MHMPKFLYWLNYSVLSISRDRLLTNTHYTTPLYIAHEGHDFTYKSHYVVCTSINYQYNT